MPVYIVFDVINDVSVSQCHPPSSSNPRLSPWCQCFLVPVSSVILKITTELAHIADYLQVNTKSLGVGDNVQPLTKPFGIRWRLTSHKAVWYSITFFLTSTKIVWYSITFNVIHCRQIRTRSCWRTRCMQCGLLWSSIHHRFNVKWRHVSTQSQCTIHKSRVWRHNWHTN